MSDDVRAWVKRLITRLRIEWKTFGRSKIVC
jgi:hypothetical protein